MTHSCTANIRESGVEPEILERKGGREGGGRGRIWYLYMYSRSHFSFQRFSYKIFSIIDDRDINLVQSYHQHYRGGGVRSAEKGICAQRIFFHCVQ